MNKSALINFIEPYDEGTKEKLRKRVPNHLGYDGSFYDDVWIYKNHANYNISKEIYFRIYFTTVPKQYKEIVKYFILRKIQSVGYMNSHIIHLSNFFNFIIDEYEIYNLNNLEYHMFENYSDEVEDMEISVKIIKGYWDSIKTFFTIMSDFPETNEITLPDDPNYKMIEKRIAKLKSLEEIERDEDSIIPKEVYIDLDKVFIKYSSGIPLHVQSVYWTLRLVPSRINEVLDMTIDKSLRKVGNEFKLTIPVPKTSSHIKIKEKIISLTGESEAEKFLIELIEKQKEVSQSLQSDVIEKGLTEGLLYTTKKIYNSTTNFLEELNYGNRLVGRFCLNDFNKCLKKIIIKADSIEDKFGNKVYNFRNETNEIYVITSHDFRHEGITDRLDYGFVTHGVMFLAGLVTEQTVFGYYNPRKATVVLSEPIYNPNEDFNNSDEKLIKSSDINSGELDSEIEKSLPFTGTAGVDDTFLDFQIKIQQYNPIVSNEGYYLGNCPNYYNCSKIKKEINCIGCKYSNKEIVEGGLKFIEKALESYRRDIDFHKENGNIRMADIAQQFYNNFDERKRQILLGDENG